MVSDKHPAGFYAWVKRKWVYIKGPVELRRKDKKLEGRLCPSQDGQIMRIQVTIPGSLFLTAPGKVDLEEVVLDGCILRKGSFIIKDQDGARIRIDWMPAGDNVIPGAEELELED